MSTIGERIKELRKEKGITQQAFADALGLKRNTVGGYEINTVMPSDRTVTDICREFNVNETWLRFGEGEMFIPISRNKEIAAFVGNIMKAEEPDFRRRLVAALAKLDVKQWELLEQIAKDLAEK